MGEPMTSFQAAIKYLKTAGFIGLFSLISGSISASEHIEGGAVYQPGHPSLQEWLMPAVPYPEGNEPTEVRVELGKKLFFDPRLSKDGNMSCATCHSPLLGWSDGLQTAKGFKSKVLGRASPTIVNTAYQSLQMWDGRKKSLEDQALGPMNAADEMNMGVESALEAIAAFEEYRALFEEAYPGQGINGDSLAAAIASFERTVTSTDSRFDRWVRGDSKALSEQEVRGFKVFNDPDKGNCAVCHSAPNFTDNGFHNIGVASYASENPDMGRHAIIPINALKGAFKTPTLRESVHTAPYFHDGSALTLEEVVDHYIKGGEVKADLSPNMKPLDIDEGEKADLVAFIRSLSTAEEPFTLPVLPK